MGELIRMTPSHTKYYQIALKKKLSYPLGRSAYAVNRIINGGLGRYLKYEDDRRASGPREYAAIQVMFHMKEETAIRWEKHIKNGGSLKALKYSEVEWNTQLKKRRAEIKAQYSK